MHKRYNGISASFTPTFHTIGMVLKACFDFVGAPSTDKRKTKITTREDPVK